MAEISLIDIFAKVRAATHTDEEAQQALADAFEALSLETRDTYTPAEVVAVGTYLMTENQKVLEQSPELPEALRPLVEAMAGMCEPLRDDLKALRDELTTRRDGG